MSFSFFLQKTWAATNRTTTVLAAGTTSVFIPYGREVVTLYGQGQPGNSPVPYTNPGTPYTNPGTPYTASNSPFTGSNSPFTGSNSPYSTSSTSWYQNCGGYSYTITYPSSCFAGFSSGFLYCGFQIATWRTYSACSTTPGTPYTNPGTPYTNPGTPYTGTNSPFTGSNSPFTGATPGNAGTPATVLGVAFPGGAVSTAAPYVPATIVSYYAYPDNTTYPVTIPSSTNITLKIE